MSAACRGREGVKFMYDSYGAESAAYSAAYGVLSEYGKDKFDEETIKLIAQAISSAILRYQEEYESNQARVKF